MKNRSKALLLALCALMLVVTTVFTTLAYLTDTKSVVNTFTVGNVKITLTESATDEYGEVTGETITAAVDTTGNNYRLVPGRTYTKDPKITVVTGSEDSYLFVKVVNEITDIAITETVGEAKTIADQMSAYGWSQLTVEGTPVQNVYVKAGTVTGGTTVSVFDEVTIKSDAVLTDTYTDAEIAITAYAVQADGFNTAEAAWTAANFS